MRGWELRRLIGLYGGVSGREEFEQRRALDDRRDRLEALGEALERGDAQAGLQACAQQ